MTHSHHSDVEPTSALQRFAARQHGLFTVAQAIEVGMTRWAIRSRLDRGEWEYVAPRVLRPTATTPLDWIGELFAQQLASPVIATGWSALALADLATPPRGPELLVHRSQRNLDRRLVHSTTILPPSDLTTVQGVRTTKVPRSLTFAASNMTDDAARELVIKTVARRKATLGEILKRADALSHLPLAGPKRLVRVTSTLDSGIALARNEWEALVVAACREFGIPDPVVDYKLMLAGRTRYFDVAWPAQLVCVEYDGYVEHLTSRERFIDDRTRQNDAVAAGWTVFRLTAQQLRPPRRATDFQAIARAVHRGPSAA